MMLCHPYSGTTNSRSGRRSTRKLDSLSNRVTAEQRKRIEAQIADTVPCPSREQYLRWKEEGRARFPGYQLKPTLANWPGPLG